MDRFAGLIGVAVMIGLAVLLSERRGRIPWRFVLVGLLVQVALVALMLVVPGVSGLFTAVAAFVAGVIARADAGIAFLFGENLADPGGPWGFVFAVRVLPIIVFFAALMAVLYHAGLMQRLIAGFAWVLRRTLGVTGAEAMAMSANVFVGQTEAPLTVRPLIAGMTRAQLATLMVGGFATIAGSVLAAYVGLLAGGDEAQRVLFTKHLITASVLSAPAAFVMARIIVPETEAPPAETAGLTWSGGEGEAVNVLDAAAAGATDGLRLALNVAAMLVAFVSLLALVNWPLEALGEWGPVAEWRTANGVPPLTLQYLLGLVFAPLAWTLGVGWQDAVPVGALLGEKIVLTEFIAYAHLAEMKAEGAVSLRSAQIATYALCGFANFPSLAIQIGGLAALAPGRRSDFASLALRAMLAGALASWMTAAIAGLFISA